MLPESLRNETLRRNIRSHLRITKHPGSIPRPAQRPKVDQQQTRSVRVRVFVGTPWNICVLWQLRNPGRQNVLRPPCRLCSCKTRTCGAAATSSPPATRVAPAQSPLRWSTSGALASDARPRFGAWLDNHLFALGGLAWKATPDRDGSFRPLIEMCSRSCRCVKVCRRNRP